jgi:hypothetical protein
MIDKILAIIEAILEAGKGLIPADEYLLLLEQLIQKSVANYEAQAGKPIDPSLVKGIDPVT